MAEDKLSLRIVTLLWCPAFKRLVIAFFPDARTGKQRLSKTRLKGEHVLLKLVFLREDQFSMTFFNYETKLSLKKKYRVGFVVIILDLDSKFYS